MTTQFKEPQDYETEPRPQIALVPVESSQIKAVGYDAETQTLAVQFTRGDAIYHYPLVPKGAYMAMMACDSVGKFFGAYIKPMAFKKYCAEQTV